MKRQTRLLVIIMILLVTAQILYLLIKGQQQTGTITQNYTARPVEPTPQYLATPIPQPTLYVLFKDTEGLVQEEEEIRKKVINPYTDFHKDSWHQEQGSRIGLKSIIIEKNTIDLDTQPYVLASEFENGRNEVIYIKKRDGVIQWWMPECNIECSFSPGFSQKYPEIVKNYIQPLPINSIY